MLYAIIGVLVLILDQGLKYWTTLNITLNTGMRELIPGVLHLANIHNYGAAFGILQNARWLFVVLAAVLTVIVIVALAKNMIPGKLGRWTAVLVLAGALGNCIDRVVLGYVVDMFELEFISFPVFNVADIFITVGAILFCFVFMFYKEPEVSEEEKAAEEAKAARLARQREVLEKQRSGMDIQAIAKGKTATTVAKPRRQAVEQENVELDDDYDPFAEFNEPKPAAGIKTAEVRDPRDADLRVPAAAEVKKAADPFAEWETSKAAPVRPVAEPKAAPAPKAEPAPAVVPAAEKPAAKSAPVDEMDFSLEDILREFKDL